MSKTQTQNPRELVFGLLQRLEDSKQFSNIALDHALSASDLSDADRRLASALFYGVIERMITLDARISQLSSRKIEDIDKKALTAIRLGLYQLMYMDKIPPHAAINETVSLCPSKSRGFVNGICRAHTRTGALELPSQESDPAAHLSVKHSVGKPLCQRFIEIFGFLKADSIFASLSGGEGTTLRINTLRISRDEFCEKAENATADELCPTAAFIKGSVRDTLGFDEGLFFVQDRASQICTAVLGAKAGETVIDVCSCPGSKSFGAAIDMNNVGKILAFDLHSKKLPLITSGAERLGIDIITAAQCDGRVSIDELVGKADRVLCDVPCSGFGVLAKKPELRYKDPTESDALPDIQLAILKNASRYVKTGGTLVYSTCTLFPSENEQNIQRFLKDNEDFVLTPFEYGKLSAPEGYLTLYPDTHGTDGFFIAKLTRI